MSHKKRCQWKPTAVTENDNSSRLIFVVGSFWMRATRYKYMYLNTWSHPLIYWLSSIVDHTQHWYWPSSYVCSSPCLLYLYVICYHDLYHVCWTYDLVLCVGLTWLNRYWAAMFTKSVEGTYRIAINKANHEHQRAVHFWGILKAYWGYCKDDSKVLISVAPKKGPWLQPKPLVQFIFDSS